VSKNTLLAFLFIFLTILFFNSPFYNKTYEKIFKKSRNSGQVINNKDNYSENKNIPNFDTLAIKKQAEIKQQTKKTTESGKIEGFNQNDTIGDTVWVENGKIICGISQIGARIISIKMKKYLYERNDKNRDSINKYIELIENEKVGGGNLEINGINYDKKRFSYSEVEKRIKINNNDKRIIDFIYKGENNNEVTKRFVFEGNSYKIGYDILSNSLDGKSIVVGWKCGITESENSTSNKISASGVNEPRKVHFYDTKSVSHVQLKKAQKEEETGFYKWAVITSKYFMIAMVADSVKNTDLLIESYDAQKIEEEKKGSMALDYGIQMRTSGEGTKERFWIYAGPSDFSIIKSYNEKFQKVLFSGWEWLLRADIWFPIICEWTLWLLIAINGIIKDYGITIIILTIIIRLITFPLTQSSMRSMSKMKDIQPKINHLRDRYKTNPRKMNEEIMALYKKEGVNPFNPGCLPMFLQMPILFALFIVLRKAIELRGVGTVLVPWVHDLSQPESLMSLTGIFPNGIPMYGSNIALLPILMAILTYFQNKMTIKDPNQKMMIYLMPPFMLVLFNNFPAGLVLYWTFSNALGIVQQYALDKSLKKNTPTSPVPVQIEKRRTGKRK
jgi:YidC/Oxa1 family membrane protein insertase